MSSTQQEYLLQKLGEEIVDTMSEKTRDQNILFIGRLLKKLDEKTQRYLFAAFGLLPMEEIEL